MERSLWHMFVPHDLPLDVMHVERHGDMPVHTHDFSELVIVLQGCGVHVSPQGEYPIAAGDVFVLHGDQAHGYRDTVDLDLVNILFRMDELPIPLRETTSLAGYHVLFSLEPMYRQQDCFESRLRLNPAERQRIDEQLKRMVAERGNQQPGWRESMMALFMLIVVDLCRCYSHMESPAVQSLLRLGNIVGYLQSHYADQITLDDLARMSCMSRRTLTREFRKATGSSPIDYVIKTRINKALDLLRDGAVSVKEAAFEVGFQDSNYFSRKFRAIVGCSPREVRRSRPCSGSR